MSYEWMENPENGPRYEKQIPPLVFNAIQRHVEFGANVGGFTTACLENDLREAVGRADVYSLAALNVIVQLLYNEIPSPAWGSPEKVRAWRKFAASVGGA